MKIQIFENAKLDLSDGFEFYERQEPGVGHYFLDSLFSDIDSLVPYAGVHSIRFGGFHWALSKRFPYAIYYTVGDDVVSVHAVLDCRQDPGEIQKRLRRERDRRW